MSMLRPMTKMMPACIILHKSNDIDRETYDVVYKVDMSTYISVVTCIVIGIIIIIIMIIIILLLLLLLLL